MYTHRQSTGGLTGLISYVNSCYGFTTCARGRRMRSWEFQKNIPTASVESRSKAKCLFNCSEVVSLPALFRPLLLAVRDASTLHLQLRLTAAVHEAHRDCGIVLCEAETWNSVTGGLSETWNVINTSLHTAGPVVISPLHHYLLIRYLVTKTRQRI